MLKRWGRGVLVLASITCMFVLGIMMGARLYAPNTADLLDMLGFLGIWERGCFTSLATAWD